MVRGPNLGIPLKIGKDHCRPYFVQKYSDLFQIGDTRHRIVLAVKYWSPTQTKGAFESHTIDDLDKRLIGRNDD